MPSTFFLPSALSLSLDTNAMMMEATSVGGPDLRISLLFLLLLLFPLSRSVAENFSWISTTLYINLLLLLLSVLRSLTEKHKFDFFYCTIIFVVFFGLLLLQIPSFFRLLLLSVSRSVAGNTRLLLLDSFYRAILLLLQTSFFFFFCTLLSSSSSSSADFFLFLLYHGHVPSQNA